MKTENLSHICGGSNGRPKFGLSSDGHLWKLGNSEEWEEFKFNELYADYYPHCKFTTIECFESGFVAAGLGDDGLPLVFTSLLGGIWEQANLMGRSMISGYIRASGRVNSILYDNISKQVFLLCENGELVTLPDCPKCVHIKKVASVGITGGYLDDEYISLTLKNSETMEIPIREAVQYRISISYAKERLSTEKGYLIDLRSEEQRKVAGFLENSLKISPHAIYEWLPDIPQKSFIVFFCSYGINADIATRYARSKGYNNAYSLGGIKKLFHVE